MVNLQPSGVPPSSTPMMNMVETPAQFQPAPTPNVAATNSILEPQSEEFPQTSLNSVSTTGQRILSLPQNGQADSQNDEKNIEKVDLVEIKSDDDEIEKEEYIELKRDEPEVERLENSGLIKEKQIGKKRRKELLEYDDRQRMLRLVDAFSDEQVNRYEMYRRSCFPRNQIKRLIMNTAGCSVQQPVSIAMAGIAKVFVGEIVEEALRVAESKKHDGPLLPSHIRESVRRLGQVDGSHLNDLKKKSRKLF